MGASRGPGPLCISSGVVPCNWGAPTWAPPAVQQGSPSAANKDASKRHGAHNRGGPREGPPSQSPHSPFGGPLSLGGPHNPGNTHEIQLGPLGAPGNPLDASASTCTCCCCCCREAASLSGAPNRPGTARDAPGGPFPCQ